MFSKDCLQRLVKQLIDLQKEHAALVEKCVNLTEELKLSDSERERLQQEIMVLKDLPIKVHVHVYIHTVYNAVFVLMLRMLKINSIPPYTALVTKIQNIEFLALQ